MKTYKVLVVDDSAFMRKIISDLIEKDAEFQVTGTARNGREAIQKIEELQPDLVTMDVEMPEMNGLEALKIIMATHPLPVIMLSGINEEGMKETILALEWGAFDFIRKPSISSSQDITGVGEALREQMKEAMLARKQKEDRIYAFRESDALTSGTPVMPVRNAALPQAQQQPKIPDSQRKKSPPAPAPGTKAEAGRNTAKSLEASKEVKREATKPPRPGASVEKHSRSSLSPPVTKGRASRPEERLGVVEEQTQRIPRPLVKPESEAGNEYSPVPRERRSSASGIRKLVGVGCSTGGPRALKALLENIPGDFPAPIVIVQHMPPNFTKSLAQRLNTFSDLMVTEAEEGMILRTGTAYIAPGGYHMRVIPASGGQYAVTLTKEEARNGHRPSVDVLFESMLSLNSLERHAVLMTGMGSDGARMMKSLYDSGVTSTFAESEDTCVVYGMPRSAVELKCVTHVLPLQEIAPRLVQAVK